MKFIKVYKIDKTTFIRQLRRWNELKIENTTKYRQKLLGFRLCVVVSVCGCVRMCVCAIVTCGCVILS